MAWSFTRYSALAGVGVAALVIAQPASAQERSFNVPAQDARQSIPEFARQAGVQISAPADTGIKTNAVKGTLDVDTALRQLIRGTGLEIASSSGGMIVLRRPENPGGNAAAASKAASSGEEGSSGSQQIVVTGTHLRSAAPTSPVITITRRDIDQTGATSVEDFMRRLPQNLSAGVAKENFAVVGTGQDITDHGAGINLRGLGQRATGILTQPSFRDPTRRAAGAGCSTGRYRGSGTSRVEKCGSPPR
jgi:hypothetical protein